MAVPHVKAVAADPAERPRDRKSDTLSGLAAHPEEVAHWQVPGSEPYHVPAGGVRRIHGVENEARLTEDACVVNGTVTNQDDDAVGACEHVVRELHGLQTFSSITP